MTDKEFSSSIEATEFIENLEAMLNDPRLEDWAKVTDQNFSSYAFIELRQAREKFNIFKKEIDNAE